MADILLMALVAWLVLDVPLAILVGRFLDRD